jgi:small subunit ribosomal protein S19
MRAIWKGPFIDSFILIQLDLLLKFKNKKNHKTIIKAWSRDSVIFPSFLGLRFYISNGKKFFLVCISKNMIGHKLGEFVPTKKKFIYNK